MRRALPQRRLGDLGQRAVRGLRNAGGPGLAGTGRAGGEAERSKQEGDRADAKERQAPALCGDRHLASATEVAARGRLVEAAFAAQAAQLLAAFGAGALDPLANPLGGEAAATGDPAGRTGGDLEPLQVALAGLLDLRLGALALGTAQLSNWARP